MHSASYHYEYLFLYLLKGLLQNFLDIHFIIRHSHIHNERKIKAK